MSILIAGWLLTYLVHSTLLIGLAWLLARRFSGLALREAIWRIALIGGLVTAGVQTFGGIEPRSVSWSLATSERPTPTRTPPEISLQRFSAASPVPFAVRSAGAQPKLERWLVGGWLAGAAALLSLLALSYVRFRRRLSGRETVVSGPSAHLLERLREQARSRPVRLSRAPRLGVPLARGVRHWEICLPAATFDRLPVERQEIVLAHELAHLRRYDPLWFAIHRSIERLFFFQPLNLVARRELREISEFRCDDWAVEITRRPISLAKCLTEVATWNLDRQDALPAPTMAAFDTRLGRRVARLLDRRYPMPNDSLPRWTAPAALACLALVALVAPGVSSRSSEAALFDLEPPAAARPAPASPEEPTTPAAAPEPDVTRLDAEAPAPPAVSPVPPSNAVLAPPPPPTHPGLPATAPLPPPPVLARVDLMPSEHELAEIAGELASHLEGWEPMVAELEELAGELAEGWEVSELEEISAELARSLPGLAQSERQLERSRELAERHERLSESHRQRHERLAERGRAARERVDTEIRRSLSERRKLMERLEVERLHGLEEMSEQRRREHVEALRDARHELREQLRRIDEELARADEGRDPRIPE